MPEPRTAREAGVIGRAGAASGSGSGTERAASRLSWLRQPAGSVPLRIPDRVFWLGAIALAILGSLELAIAPFRQFIDFPQFWAAGRTVGTPALVDPGLHTAWEAANGLGLGWWVYPPGSAWLFVPFGFWSLAVGYWLHAAVMTGLVVVAAVLGARIYGLDRRVGLAVAFAWTPAMGSAIVGQNAMLGLVLALVAIEGLRRDDDLLAGLAVGLLLYKPTLALPLIGLLLLRRRWPALLVGLACAVGWYLAGVAAAAGDWQWPGRWVSIVGDYYTGDTAFNVARTISVPGLLQGHGAPAALTLGIGLVMVVLAIPRLVRAPIIEAGAGALLVGLAVSPHTLNYEGAMVLPALMWAIGNSATGISEPARTRLVLAAYLVAPIYLFAEAIGFSSLVFITFIGAAVWISGWRRIRTQDDEAGGGLIHVLQSRLRRGVRRAGP